MVMDSKDCYIGDEAQNSRGVLSLDYPIEHGIVTNWDDMELLWHDIYGSYLEVPPEEHPCLLTEPPLNPKNIREKMAQLFFAKFKVPAFYVSMQGVLSSYWSGRGSAIILEIGDGVTRIVPVCEGYCIQSAVKRLDLGGRDLTSYLQILLPEKGHDFVTTGDFEIVREMKENICYVAEDYSKEITKSECFPDIDKSYELPDGNLITIGFAKRLQKEFATLIPERMLTNVVFLQKEKIPRGLVDQFLSHYQHFNPCGSQKQSSRNTDPILSTENVFKSQITYMIFIGVLF